jgi:hypothetical protein
MKKFGLLSLLLLTLIQSCNFPKIGVKEVKFKPEIQEVADKYKALLKAEKFQTTSGFFRFDTITTHKVIVYILNSKNSPGSEREFNDMAIKIASDVYTQLLNKEDFSQVEIIFQNQAGTIVRMTSGRNFQYSYEEIEAYKNKL